MIKSRTGRPRGVGPRGSGRRAKRAEKRPLTAREREILNLLAEGVGTEGIRQKLVLAHATVRNHVQRILTKLGAHSRLEALARAREQGLLRASGR